MNTAAKNIIVITLITVVAGLLLGVVYDVTKDPIATQQMIAKQEAYMAVFPEAASFEDAGVNVDDLNTYVESNGFTYDSVNEVLSACASDGTVLGYVFGLTSSEGYGGNIAISMGVSNDGTVKGVEILSISETAGLGMKADTDDFKSQFSEKNVSRFNYTKTGKSADYEIDALSGATITTNAMTNVVNAGLCCFEKIGGVQ